MKLISVLFKVISHGYLCGRGNKVLLIFLSQLRFSILDFLIFFYSFLMAFLFFLAAFLYLRNSNFMYIFFYQLVRNTLYKVDFPKSSYFAISFPFFIIIIFYLLNNLENNFQVTSLLVYHKNGYFVVLVRKMKT